MKKIILFFSFISVVLVSLCLTSCGSLESFNFDNNYLTISIGETKKSTSIEDANNEVNYFSGNDSIARVDNEGNITGVAVGETTIYALFNNEHFECFVKVISNDTKKELEIYQKDLVLTGTYNETKLKSALPIKATYYGHNTQIELEDDMKIQLIADFSKLPEETYYESKGEQYRDNLETFGAILLYLSMKYSDDESLKMFNGAFITYCEKLLDVDDPDQYAEIVESSDPFIAYVYLTNDYLSLALFEGDTILAYYYSNENYGIVKDIKAAVLLVDELINKGYNIQKLDFIKLIEKFDGEIISEELRTKLKRYQNAVSLLSYLALGELDITKSTIDGDSNKQNIDINVREDGIKKINEYSDKIEVYSFGLSLDIYRALDTHYTFIENISLNVSSKIGTTCFKLHIGELQKVNDESLFIYEKNHSEYEKMEFNYSYGD